MIEQQGTTYPRWCDDTMTIADAQDRHAKGYPVEIDGDRLAYYRAPLEHIIKIAVGEWRLAR